MECMGIHSCFLHLDLILELWHQLPGSPQQPVQHRRLHRLRIQFCIWTRWKGRKKIFLNVQGKKIQTSELDIVAGWGMIGRIPMGGRIVVDQLRDWKGYHRRTIFPLVAFFRLHGCFRIGRSGWHRDEDEEHACCQQVSSPERRLKIVTINFGTLKVEP